MSQEELKGKSDQFSGNALQSREKESEKATMQAKAASRSSLSPASKVTKTGKGAKSQGAFLTIREVSDALGVQQHVLRFWETKFSQIKPLKRGGGRRYYRPDDVTLIKNIQHLLHVDGYTIKGVQKLLRTEGKKALSQSLIADVGGQESKEEAKPADTAIAQGHNEVAVQVKETDAEVARQESDLQQASRATHDRIILSAVLEELKALRNFIVTSC